MQEIDVAVARPSNSARFCAMLVSNRKSSSDPAQPLCMQQLYRYLHSHEDLEAPPGDARVSEEGNNHADSVARLSTLCGCI
jgi:hypothetical protein